MLYAQIMFFHLSLQNNKVSLDSKGPQVWSTVNPCGKNSSF